MQVNASSTFGMKFLKKMDGREIGWQQRDSEKRGVGVGGEG